MYHGTSEQAWAAIQEEGVLWGIRDAPSRCTYLATERQEAAQHGPVVLAVKFDPQIDAPNNYIDGAWQCRVYSPIPIDRVQRAR